jgi:hypothetical protein
MPWIASYLAMTGTIGTWIASYLAMTRTMKLQIDSFFAMTGTYTDTIIADFYQHPIREFSAKILGESR